jgi:hypothetical protein
MEGQDQTAKALSRSQPIVPIQQEFLFVDASEAQSSERKGVPVLEVLALPTPCQPQIQHRRARLSSLTTTAISLLSSTRVLVCSIEAYV